MAEEERKKGPKRIFLAHVAVADEYENTFLGFWRRRHE